MIDVAELLEQSRSKGNLYSTDAYVTSEIELGLIENRFGSRLVALPDTLLKAIETTLEHEVGGAKFLIQEQYGRWWGRTFYRRFLSEIQAYYDKPLAELTMIDFIQCLKQCWISYGWGTIDVKVDAYQQGFLVVELCNPASETATETETGTICSVESGFLTGFFGQLTEQDLSCVEVPKTASEETHHFILGLPERLKSVSAMIEEGHDYQTIMDRLCDA